MRAALAITMTLLLATLLAPPAAPAAGLGIPKGTPTLFSLSAERGTLTPTAKKGQFVLTLTRLDRRGVWFTDRPARQSGAVTPGGLFSSWKALGFTKDPPNAVVNVLDGRERADTVALELGAPRYDARTRGVRFTATALGSLSAGLAHHGPKLDRTLPRRFGQASLFIDDGQWDGPIGTGGDCQVGEIVLFVNSRLPSNVQAADGSTLSINQNTALFSLYGTTFGAAPAGTFRLPKLTAPTGMTYGLCLYGRYPGGPSGGPDRGCSTGELDLFVEQPASNWTARPDVAAPAPGLAWYQCAAGQTGDNQYECTMGQLTPFALSPLGVGYTPAAGQGFAIWQEPALYALVGPTFGGDSRAWFALPTLAGPAAGTTYGFCTDGVFPSFY